MLSAVQMTVWSAILLTMVGALFGVAIARVVWADDLKQAQTILEHSQKMKAIWDDTKTSMESTIKSQAELIRLMRANQPGFKDQ